MNEPLPASPQPSPRPSPYRRNFVLLLVAGLLFLFLHIVWDLLAGVIAGLLLWAFTRGLFLRIVHRVRGRRKLAASLTLIVTLLIVVVPLMAVISLMIADGATFVERVGQWYAPHRADVTSRLERLTNGGSLSLFGFEISADQIAARIEEVSGQIGQFAVTMIQKTAGGLARAALLLFVTLYTLFFCYLDGDRFLAWLKDLLPLAPEQSEHLLNNFFSTSRATLKSVGIIGLVQGTLGGLAMWICGIPSPFFWTILLAVTSVIPAVGAQIILVPASVMLILVGKTGAGIGLFLWSWIVVANADNLLRPYLVRREVNLHEMAVFLSTIGGIATFGFPGVVFGPVIAALLLSCLQIYKEVVQS